MPPPNTSNTNKRPTTYGKRTRYRNVRPRRHGSSESPEEEHDSQEEQMGGEEEEERRWDSPAAPSRPFAGVLICCSKLEQRDIMFRYASEMGATTSGDLTDQVTHLVTDTYGSAKSQCAVERQIPIMAPRWVFEAYRQWSMGIDFSVEESMERHHLPIFGGLTLLISGAPNLHDRGEISSLINGNGGTFTSTATPEVTHVIVFEENDKGTGSNNVENREKVAWARRINMLRQKNKEEQEEIKVVWEVWLWDCIAYHGRWNEASYDVGKDPPPRKHPSAPKNSSIGRSRSETNPFSTILEWRVVASSQATSDVFHSPTGGSSPPSQYSPPAQRRSWVQVDAYADESGPDFLHAPIPPSPIPQVPIPTLSSPMIPTLPIGPPSPIVTRPSSLSQASGATQSAKIFDGTSFWVLGDAKSPVLLDSIRKLGGTLADDGDTADVIIVRLTSSAPLLKSAPLAQHPRFRTECWLEQCILLNQVVEVTDNIVYSPIKFPVPIAGVDLFNIHLSGFDPLQMKFYQRLARALGMRISDAFLKGRTTHLVVPSMDSAKENQKYQTAMKWVVPVVDIAWLVGFAVSKDDAPPSQASDSGSITPKAVPADVLNIIHRETETVIGEGELSFGKPVVGLIASPTIRPLEPLLKTPPLRHINTQPSFTTVIPSSASPPLLGSVDGLLQTHEDLMTLLGKHPVEPDSSEDEPSHLSRKRRKSALSNRPTQSADGAESSAKSDPLLLPVSDITFGSQPTSQEWETGANEAMSLTYEDPAQRAERARLMSLFEDPILEVPVETAEVETKTTNHVPGNPRRRKGTGVPSSAKAGGNGHH